MKIEHKLEKYSSCMEEIKLRTEVIRAFLDGRANALYEHTTMECICLQVRKILELIALSSLVANVEEYSKKKESFAKHSHAEFIINEIRSINPNFYPVPTIKRRDEKNPKLSHQEPVTSGFLTEKELVNIYSRCGGLLHANNPFAGPKDIKNFIRVVPGWMDKIVKLLNHHIVHFIDEESIFICIMNSEGSGKVQVTHFVRE